MAEIGFSYEGLDHGIERCKVNIASLETAIERERTTIKEYRKMMDSIEASLQLKKEAEDNIHVEIVRD
jgi:hypothetical protein